MTFTPESTPIDPTEHLAHMSPRALMAHIRAAVGHLATAGVTIAGEAQRGLDEIEEAILELEHRRPADAAAKAKAVATVRNLLGSSAFGKPQGGA